MERGFPLLLFLVIVLALAAVVFINSGRNIEYSASPSIREIIEKNLGYYCEWNGKIKSFTSFSVWGKYYFAGRMLRFEEKGLAGVTVVLDRDITNEEGNVYQWSILSKKGKPQLVLTFSKRERSPETFEELLKIVYVRQDEPFEKVLREVLRKAEERSRESGIAVLDIKAVRCTQWSPDPELFEPPEKGS